MQDDRRPCDASHFFQRRGVIGNMFENSGREHDVKAPISETETSQVLLFEWHSRVRLSREGNHRGRVIGARVLDARIESSQHFVIVAAGARGIEKPDRLTFDPLSSLCERGEYRIHLSTLESRQL